MTDVRGTSHLVEHYFEIATSMHENPLVGWVIRAKELHEKLSISTLSFLEAIKDTVESRSETTAGLFLQMQTGAAHGYADNILTGLHFHKLMGSGEYLQNAALVSSFSEYIGVIPLSHPLRDAEASHQDQYLTIMRFVREFMARDHEEANDWVCDYPDDLLEYDGRALGGVPLLSIKDPAMTRFVLAHPDRIEEIVSVIKDREVTDPETILSVIDSGVLPALRNGAL
jgi:hypothetical protein